MCTVSSMSLVVQLKLFETKHRSIPNVLLTKLFRLRFFLCSCKLHKTAIVRAVLFCLFCAYWIYFGFAVAYDLELAVSLIVMTGIVIFCIIYVYIRNHFGEKIYNSCCLPIGVVWDRTWPTTKWYRSFKI